MHFIKHACSRMHPLSVGLTWRTSGFGVSFGSQWFPVWPRSFGICAGAEWHELALHTLVIVWRGWRTHHSSPKDTKQPVSETCCFSRASVIVLVKLNMKTFPPWSLVSLGRIFSGAGYSTLVWLLRLSDLPLSELESDRPARGFLGKSGNECWCLI